MPRGRVALGGKKTEDDRVRRIASPIEGSGERDKRWLRQQRRRRRRGRRRRRRWRIPESRSQLAI